MIRYLKLEDILQLHTLVLLKDGGAEGVRDLGRLEAAVAVQLQGVFGEELYPTVYEKAAAMMRGIIGDHPFSDGNKRTAMLTGLTLLELNGCTVTIRQGELEDFAVKIAVEKFDVAEIAVWLEGNARV